MIVPEVAYGVLGMFLAAVGFMMFFTAFRERNIDPNIGGLLVAGGYLVMLFGLLLSLTVVIYPDQWSWLPGVPSR